MKFPPEYPDYITPGPIRWRRWGILLAAIWLIGSFLALLLRSTEQAPSGLAFWFFIIGFPSLFWALALAIRYLLLQIGLKNRSSYQQVVEQEQNDWWQERSLGIAIEKVYLIGPLGDEQSLYSGIMTGGTPAPNNPTLLSLRYPLLLNMPTVREQGLAHHLAQQLINSPEIKSRWQSLAYISWFGDEASFQIFIETIKSAVNSISFIRLDLKCIDDVDHVIDVFQQSIDANKWMLCAGTYSLSQSADAIPAGEAGFAWIASQAGNALLHRAEEIDVASDVESGMAARHLERYAHLDDMPECCLAMDQKSMAEFQPGGWSAIEHILAPYWGALGEISPYIAISMSLLHTLDTQQPCGWMSQCTENKMVIGVTVPHGNR